MKTSEDLKELQAIEDEEDLADVKKALADAKERGTVPISAVQRKYNLQEDDKCILPGD